MHLYFVVFALCSPSAQLLTMVRFAWSLTRLDTFTLHEGAPQNRLWNGWAVVEVSEFVFHVFCLMLTICSVTYHGLFCMISDSFGYLHTPWRCSTKPFMKQFSCCGGKWICISCFFALCSPSAQLLTMVRFAWFWTRLDTFILCEGAPQNRLQNS